MAQTARLDGLLDATLNSAVGADAALVRLFVTSNLSPTTWGRRPDRRAPGRARDRGSRLSSDRRDRPDRDPPARRHGPRGRASRRRGACRRAVAPTSPPRSAARPATAAIAERGERSGRTAARDERRPARVLPARHRRPGPRRRRGLARRGADPRDRSTSSGATHPRDPVRRAHRRDRPVPRLPRRPGPDHAARPPPSSRPPTRPADRHAQPRRARRPRRRGRRARPARPTPRSASRSSTSTTSGCSTRPTATTAGDEALLTVADSCAEPCPTTSPSAATDPTSSCSSRRPARSTS